MQSYTVSSHLEEVLLQPNRKETIQWLLQELTPRQDLFDGIAICGTSGLLVGPVIADALNKDIVLVRKPTDDSHSKYLVEGYRPGRYVIIDDLVCTGKTIAFIIQAMKVHCEHAKCVGLALYHHKSMCFGDGIEKMHYVHMQDYELAFHGLVNQSGYRCRYSIIDRTY